MQRAVTAATLKSLFSLDKSKEGYSFQLVVWDNANPDTWDDEFVFHSADMDDEASLKRVTNKLIRFLREYKETPLKGKVTKPKRSAKKKKATL